MHRFNFLRLFDDMVVSGTERLVKPDPASFALTRAVRAGAPRA
jgi:FMN phosphatase YigB (HAD superfamily)